MTGQVSSHGQFTCLILACFFLLVISVFCRQLPSNNEVTNRIVSDDNGFEGTLPDEGTSSLTDPSDYEDDETSTMKARSLHYQPDAIAGISCQILPRASMPSMAANVNTPAQANLPNTTTSTSSWNDGMVMKGAFSLPQNTEEFLKMMFEKKEKVTVPSSSSEPKNAVLLDSLLLKSAGPGVVRPTDSGLIITRETRTEDPQLIMLTEKTKTDADDNDSSSTTTSHAPFDQADIVSFQPASTSTVSSVLGATNVTLRYRQAKQGQTGRPNFFFLDDASSDFDPNGNSFQSSDLSGNGKPSSVSAQTSKTDTLEYFASTTIDPFGSFYSVADQDGMIKTSTAFSRRLTSAQTVDNSLTTTIPFAVSSASNPNLISGHFSLQDIPIDSANKLSSKPAALNAPENRKRPLPNYPPNQAAQSDSSIRRQGSVFSAPSPLSGGGPRGGNYDGQTGNGGMLPASRPVGSQPGWSYHGAKGADGNSDSDGTSGQTSYMDAPDGNVPPPFQVRPSAAIVDNGIKLETCSIGDDSTCTDSFNEVCRLDEDGAATCLCRMGSARLRLREQCRGSLNYLIYVRINRLQDYEVRFGPQFMDKKSRPYRSLERQVLLGIDSVMRASPLAGQYAGNKVNSFSSISEDAILANVTVTLFKGLDTSTSILPNNIQEAVTDQLRLSQRRLGTSNVYVGSLLTAIPSVQDINECLSSDLNDCPANVSICSNNMGSFSCSCRPGYADRHIEDPLRSGRICETCQEAYCNQHGICLLDSKGEKMCQCNGWYIGATCQTDGQVVAVACGSSAIAVILIAITLLFLLRWSRSSASSRGDPSSSTLGRSEISANTFTYVKTATGHPLNTLSQTSLENKLRMAYLVHPSLLSQNEMASHSHAGSDQLLQDSNFYEVRPPPGRLGPSQALIAAEMLYRKQRSGSRDQLHLASDLSSLEWQVRQKKDTIPST